jgi:DNA-3-methyladenine glycosylase II
MTHTSTFTLTPVPPYDFDLSCSIFSKGDPQIRRYEDGQLRYVIRLSKKLVLALVQGSGTVNAPGLEVTLESRSPLTQGERRQAALLIYDTFMLGLDLKPFYRAVKHDPVFTSITANLKGLRFMKTATVFEALVDAICEQQISLTVARAIETRIIKAFGDPLKIGADTHYAFPTPQSLAAGRAIDSCGQARVNLSSEHGEREGEARQALPDEGATRAPVINSLRACGLSRKKAEYIQGMAGMVAKGELDPERFPVDAQTDDIIEQFTSIRGIGLWTAEYALIRGMARLESMPADDLGIRRCISRYYFRGDPVTAAQARATAESWGPWRGLASFYLLSAERLNITP